MDIKETRCENEVFFEISHDRVKFLALVNTLINPGPSKKAENTLNSWADICFSRRSLLNGANSLVIFSIWCYCGRHSDHHHYHCCWKCRSNKVSVVNLSNSTVECQMGNCFCVRNWHNARQWSVMLLPW